MTSPAPDERLTLPEALERLDDMALILAAIKSSGLSARKFATEILTRDERTVRRWLAGDAPVPAPVRAFCLRSLTPPA